MLAGFLQLSWLVVLAAWPDSERIYRHMLGWFVGSMIAKFYVQICIKSQETKTSVEFGNSENNNWC